LFAVYNNKSGVKFRRHVAEVQRSGEVQHQAFKEALSRLLTDDYVRINPDEEQIGQRVEILIRTLLDRKKVSLSPFISCLSFVILIQNNSM